MSRFTHLHLHSVYSARDSISHIEKKGKNEDEDFGLVAKIRDIGQKAFCLTDHGNCFGAIKAYNLAKDKKYNLKFILGMEAYISAGKFNDMSKENSKNY